MVVDDHDVGFLRAAPSVRNEAPIDLPTLAAKAVLSRRGYAVS
jgi:hypothetical protein